MDEFSDDWDLLEEPNERRTWLAHYMRKYLIFEVIYDGTLLTQGGGQEKTCLLTVQHRYSDTRSRDELS